MGSAKGRLGGLRGGKFQVQNLCMILHNVELLRYDAPCDFDGKKAVGMKHKLLGYSIIVFLGWSHPNVQASISHSHHWF